MIMDYSKVSTNAWANNSTTCPSDAITVDDKLLKQFHTVLIWVNVKHVVLRGKMHKIQI